MARSKKQIWYFDLAKIERDDEPLNQTELDVKARLAHDPREQLDLKLVLHDALQQLTPKQRTVIELTAQGYTEQEIAQQLHISQPAVHHLLTKAQARLRKILQGGY